MNFNEFTAAVEDAKTTLRRADRAIEQLVPLLVGRLRTAHLSSFDLGRLKRELKDFDLRTHSWKR